MNTDTMHDQMLYKSWVEVLDWMRQYAQQRGMQFVKESDFPDFIYRMERSYELPTTVAVASISDARGEPFFIAAVSPRHAELKHISLRVPGGHIHYHAHWEDPKGLVLEGKLSLDKTKLFSIMDRAKTALAKA
jgi:hypothetical protein